MPGLDELLSRMVCLVDRGNRALVLFPDDLTSRWMETLESISRVEATADETVVIHPLSRSIAETLALDFSTAGSAIWAVMASSLRDLDDDEREDLLRALDDPDSILAALAEDLEDARTTASENHA